MQAESQVIGTEVAEEQASSGRIAKWVKRFGVAGFLFFFIKGLLWLIIPAALVAWRTIGS